MFMLRHDPCQLFPPHLATSSVSLWLFHFLFYILWRLMSLVHLACFVLDSALQICAFIGKMAYVKFLGAHRARAWSALYGQSGPAWSSTSIAQFDKAVIVQEYNTSTLVKTGRHNWHRRLGVFTNHDELEQTAVGAINFPPKNDALLLSVIYLRLSSFMEYISHQISLKLYILKK
jgi:hypothetical protein